MGKKRSLQHGIIKIEATVAKCRRIHDNASQVTLLARRILWPGLGLARLVSRVRLITPFPIVLSTILAPASSF